MQVYSKTQDESTDEKPEKFQSFHRRGKYF